MASLKIQEQQEWKNWKKISPLSLITPGSITIIADYFFVYVLRKLTGVWVSCEELFEWMVCACCASFLLCMVQKDKMGSELPCVKCLSLVYMAALGKGKAMSHNCLSLGENLGLSHLPYVHFYVIFRKVIYPSPLFVCQAGMKLAMRSERCYGKEQQTNRPIALAWALFLQLVRMIFWSFSFVRVKALSCGYMLIKCNNTTSPPHRSV